MKKAVLALSLIIVSFSSHATISSTENIDNRDVIKIETNIEDDICTVTVTVRRSDGRSFSATATNNQGNCSAAEEAAEGRARLLASVLE